MAIFVSFCLSPYVIVTPVWRSRKFKSLLWARKGRNQRKPVSFHEERKLRTKISLTVGALFLLSYTKQIYFVLSRVCILFCCIVFGRQNVVETSEINRWLRHSWLLVNRYKFSGNSHLFCNVRQKGWGKRKCEIASKKPNRQKSFSCLTNNDFDHDDGVKCNGDDSTVVVVEPLLLPCGWYNPGGRAPLNEKGASGDDRHTHLQV